MGVVERVFDMFGEERWVGVLGGIGLEEECFEEGFVWGMDSVVEVGKGGRKVVLRRKGG